MNGPIRILHLEDSPLDAERIRTKLETGGLDCNIVRVDREEGFAAALAAEAFDVVLCDYNLADYDGFSALRQSREKQPNVPVLVISGTLGEEEAVECLKEGATDYVLKQRLDRLPAAVTRALQEARERRGRLETERALRISHERFQIVTRATNDLVWDWDLETNALWWNENASCFGYWAGEIEPGRGAWVDRMHPEDKERVLRGLHAVFDGGRQAWSDKYRFRCRDGSYAAVFDRGHVMRDETGRATRMIGAMQDITELERLNHELAEREARLRDILEGDPDCVQVLAADGSVLEMNRAGLQMIEADSFQQVATLSIYPLVVDEYRAAFRELTENVFRGESGTLEFQIAGLKGTRCWLETHATPLRAPTGAVIGSLGISRNITERKQAAAALLRSEERFFDLFENANDLIQSVRPDGSILYVNRAWRETLGYSTAEAAGLSLKDIIDPPSLAHCMRVFQELLEGKEGGRIEAVFLAKDGRKVHVEGSSNCRFEDGQPVATRSIFRDLTERMHLQAQFLQSQKMESVGQLAGGIAHDFNNLLTVINGIADLALEDLTVGDGLRADLQQIRDAGNRAASLTRQLLAFSRKQIMKLEVLDLNIVVSDMRSMLERLIGEHIELTINPKGGGSVRVDRGQIEQVVMNLAVNARDAMPNGGALTIETNDVELDAAFASEHPSVKPGPHVMLAVSDTGAGMNEATLKRIFEPFYTTKGPARGTGLGLSTVYGIVKQSEGSIWVYSEPGLGTAFKVYLPHAKGVMHTHPPPVTPTAARGTETILLVEDDPGVRHLATLLLQSAGHLVVTAGSGAEALVLLERHDGPVHLLLTDVVMPGMTGPDLAARLTSLRPRMKVLYTSGYTDDTILLRGLIEDDAHFIGKPYTKAQLNRKVREVLDSVATDL